uniref:Interleukin-17A n=1 Tax=Ascaris lumbricoides TaxID=6252 RepID=A0A0M3IJ73_ASCLU
MVVSTSVAAMKWISLLTTLATILDFSGNIWAASISRTRNPHNKTQQRLICREPTDMLFAWLKESSENAALEVIDEDWISPLEESGICDTPPETGSETSVMQRSLCPWQWKLNHDENREPKVLSEAYCLCRKSRGSSGALCMPIKRDIAVMKRILCDPTTGRYEYVRSLHTITVGCHSVLPRTQRARPLNKFYRSAFTIEI